MAGDEGAGHRIARVEIENPGVVRYHSDVEREIKVAIYDLVETNLFAPDAAHFASVPDGPYVLVLQVQGRQLLLDISNQSGVPVGILSVPMTPFRKTIKDYFTVCESYYEAIRSASPAQIEALDMGRRGLHNEGSDRLQKTLKGRIMIDHDTSRRLFTLICALHIRV
ncbi:MAG: hypothetical protein CL573_06955 [Alphaproteobacteria bacterium]|nr:hypothetical protein [Alphaproteobacteria bacterium]HCP01780.1 hypothetical protein [Rhodospirillaceae bacterium]